MRSILVPVVWTVFFMFLLGACTESTPSQTRKAADELTDHELSRILAVCEKLTDAHPEAVPSIIDGLDPVDRLLFDVAIFVIADDRDLPIEHPVFTRLTGAALDQEFREAVSKALVSRDLRTRLQRPTSIDEYRQARRQLDSLVFGAMEIIEGYVYDGRYSREAAVSIPFALTQISFIAVDRPLANDMMRRMTRVLLQMADDDEGSRRLLQKLFAVQYLADPALWEPLLRHGEPRVRFFAAKQVARTGSVSALKIMAQTALDAPPPPIRGRDLVIPPPEDVVRELVPELPRDVKGRAVIAWLQEHADSLQWDDESETYVRTP